VLSSEDTTPEYWSVVANIKRELPYGEGGIETRNGTKQFKGGAKVYIIGSYPGMCDSLITIGQNKHTGKFISTVIKVSAVENLRIKNVYGESALSLCKQEAPNGASMITSKEDAEYLEELIPEWSKC
jgi:hypothetical protein